MANLNAYLTFNGKCKEAMEFYKECLGGELQIMMMGESPMASTVPPEAKNNVMHSLLASGNIRLMASDMMQSTETIQGNTVSLCIVGEDKGEIEKIFSKLSEGGKIGNPLKEEFFGTYGDLTDKYGFRWMFQFGAGQR